MRKSFFVFFGAFCGKVFLLFLKNLIHYNCLNLKLLIILFIGTYRPNAILFVNIVDSVLLTLLYLCFISCLFSLTLNEINKCILIVFNCCFATNKV